MAWLPPAGGPGPGITIPPPEPSPGPPPINPYGGTLPPNFPPQPKPEDFYIYDDYGKMVDPGTGDYLESWDRWSQMAADQAEYDRWGLEGQPPRGAAGGPSPEQLAIERSKVHAQNMATFLNATVAEIGLEVEAGRLRLDQAQAEFDRRMDAFAEGGKQMGEMWQWTVAPGTEQIHADLRANLGMQPWESQAVEFDPFAMAWDIVEQTPEILVESPSFDPLTEAIDLVEQFV